MYGIVLVEDTLKCNVRGTEAVAEVLGKDPGGVGVGSLLDSVSGLLATEKRVVGKAVEKGGLLNDLREGEAHSGSTNRKTEKVRRAGAPGGSSSQSAATSGHPGHS